jgi:hypothetical protein
MPLITPPLVQTAFADSGDKTVVPQSDASGFVSFLNGYTPDYELNLAAGDPQAKAVERGIQNYLFNSGSLATKAWQHYNRPPWYNNMPGGYGKWAEVVFDTGDGQAKPYRSLAAGNVSSPGNSATWEYIEGTGELVKHIAMPTGGTQGPSSYLVTSPTDLNTFITSGSWQFLNDTVIGNSPNTPVNGGNKGQAGMLEVTAWADGVTSYVTQFYRDKNGLSFMRGATNGAWTAWKIWANAQQFVIGEVRMWSGQATQAAVTAAWGPGWHLCDGTLGTVNLRDRFILASGGTYATGAVGGAAQVALAIANMPAHNHGINIGDSGHSHVISDPGHNHGISDPGHSHGVYDPTHNHDVADPGHAHGVSDPGHNHSFNGGAIAIAGSSGGFFLTAGGSTGTSVNGTGISINGSGTGIGIYGRATGIQIYGNGTGVGVAWGGTNVSAQANVTGITASSNNAGGGAAFSIVPPYYALAYVMYTGA